MTRLLHATCGEITPVEEPYATTEMAQTLNLNATTASG